MSLDVEKLFNDWRNSIAECAKASADYEYLYHFRKTIIAILMVEALEKGVDVVAAQDRYARSHPKYKEVLKGLKAAKEISEGLKYRMRLAESRIAVWQTEQANSRAEYKKYGN